MTLTRCFRYLQASMPICLFSLIMLDLLLASRLLYTGISCAAGMLLDGFVTSCPMPVLLLLGRRCVGGSLEAAKVHDPPWGEQVPWAPSSHSVLLEPAACHSHDYTALSLTQAVLRRRHKRLRDQRQAHG